MDGAGRCEEAVAGELNASRKRRNVNDGFAIFGRSDHLIPSQIKPFFSTSRKKLEATLANAVKKEKEGGRRRAAAAHDVIKSGATVGRGVPLQTLRLKEAKKTTAKGDDSESEGEDVDRDARGSSAKPRTVPKRRELWMSTRYHRKRQRRR
jgi:hypothetical protein